MLHIKKKKVKNNQVRPGFEWGADLLSPKLGRFCPSKEQRVFCSVPRSVSRCWTDKPKQLKVNGVQRKEFHLTILWAFFFFFFHGGNTFAEAIKTSLVSVSVHAEVWESQHRFGYTCCQNKEAIIYSKGCDVQVYTAFKWHRGRGGGGVCDIFTVLFRNRISRRDK